MKYYIGITLSLIIGCLLGFFGVFVSVFADGSLFERLITILVILLIYGALSALLGFLLPKYYWKWGLILASPGAVILCLYMLREFNPFYIIYILLIFGFSCLGALNGTLIKIRRKL